MSKPIYVIERPPVFEAVNLDKSTTEELVELGFRVIHQDDGRHVQASRHLSDGETRPYDQQTEGFWAVRGTAAGLALNPWKFFSEKWFWEEYQPDHRFETEGGWATPAKPAGPGGAGDAA